MREKGWAGTEGKRGQHEQKQRVLKHSMAGGEELEDLDGQRPETEMI